MELEGQYTYKSKRSNKNNSLAYSSRRLSVGDKLGRDIMNKDCFKCQYGDAGTNDFCPCGRCVINDLAIWFVPVGCLGIQNEAEP